MLQRIKQVVKAHTRPSRPPRGGCDEGARLKYHNPGTARGGPGGTARGNEGARGERARAAPRHRSRPPHARYDWREWGRRFTAQTLKQPTRNGARNAPAPPASGNLLSLRERVTLVSPAEQTKRFCERAAWFVAGGGAYTTTEAAAARNPGATDPRNPGGAREKRPTK